MFSFKCKQIKHSTEKANYSYTVPPLLEHFKNMYFEFKLEKPFRQKILNILYLFTYNPLQNRTITCTDKMFVMLKWNVHEFILNLKQAENDEKHSKEFKTWCNDSRCIMNWTTTKKFLAVLFIEVKLLWYSKD